MLLLLAPTSSALLLPRAPRGFGASSVRIRMQVVVEEPCMQLVHMQSPASTGAQFWSEVLMESGALSVSLSDGA